MSNKLIQVVAVLAAAVLVAGAHRATPKPPVIVATNLSGSVSVQSPSGNQRDLVTTQVLHSGDVVTTGQASLAVIQLADVGKVTLGPTTTATTFTQGTDLSVEVAAGLVCVEADKPGVSVNAGSLLVASKDTSTIFDLEQNSGDTKFAVYRGAVNATTPDNIPSTLRAGAAAASSPGGTVHQIPLTSIQVDFAALDCPEAH